MIAPIAANPTPMSSNVELPAAVMVAVVDGTLAVGAMSGGGGKL